MLPGGRPINISDFRAKFEAEWKGTLPEKDGLTLLEMIEGARDHTIKAMYVMGENPVFNLPDSLSVKEALSGLDFLVVQDLFLTETAEMADVVLPALGWTEKTGTYTNLERRVQLQKKAVEQPHGMEDWRIIAELSNKMGYAMNYSDTEDVMREMAKISPLYRDLTYNEIAQGNCLWPYHGEPLRGEVNEVPEMQDVDREYNADFYLAVEKPLFHSGTLSRRSEALMKIYSEPVLKVGESAAVKLGLQDGDRVQFTTSSGSMEAPVAIDDSIKNNRVYYSNNFKSGGVFSVMKFNIDKVTNAPGIEGCEVRIKKL
jgi:formate dehydrogenase major subunit/formate dehydrogenase alpha subunit